MEFVERIIPEMCIVGIELRTDNSEGGFKKISEHWRRFYAEQVLQSIPNRKNDSVIALYTDYEKDHTRPYSLILGAEVNNKDVIPKDMVTKRIPEQKYAIFTATGTMPEAVIQTWQTVWNSNLRRKYSSDFEIYHQKTDQGEKLTVDICVALQELTS